MLSLFKMTPPLSTLLQIQFFQILKEGDFTEIHEQLGKEVLPEEYGGTNGKLQDHLGNFLSNQFCFPVRILISHHHKLQLYR